MHYLTIGRRLITSIGVVAAALVLAGSQLVPVSASGTVSVGARSFTEEQIAGYLYSEILSAHGVSTSTNVGFGTESEMFTALSSGAVDVVPDYLGNGLVHLNQVYRPGKTVQQVWNHVNHVFKKDYSIELLQPAMKFDDQNVFVTTKAISKKYGLKTLSDLARLAPKLKFEVMYECTTRTDCLIGFDDVYHPKKFKQLADPTSGTSPNNPPFYGDLLSGKFDVVQGYGTTDPQIAKYHLVPLKDNLRMFPPDQMTPFVRESTAAANPKIAEWLDKLSAVLTTKNFTQLDVEGYNGEQPQAVAHAFLKQKGLL